MGTPRKNTLTTQTGRIPRVELESAMYDPPQPLTLPLLDDEGGTTGVLIVRPEGDDSAKHADDSASGRQARRR